MDDSTYRRRSQAMTAPKPLPQCPYPGCKRTPERDSIFGGKVSCEYSGTHIIKVYGRTQAEADARWRRLAGSRK